jgi:hypothetical protein
MPESKNEPFKGTERLHLFGFLPVVGRNILWLSRMLNH